MDTDALLAELAELWPNGDWRLLPNTVTGGRWLVLRSATTEYQATYCNGDTPQSALMTAIRLAKYEQANPREAERDPEPSAHTVPHVLDKVVPPTARRRSWWRRLFGA